MGIVSKLIPWWHLTESPLITNSFLLVRHPNVLERLRSEITSTVSEGEKLTRLHIQQMPYLKNVLNESTLPSHQVLGDGSNGTNGSLKPCVSIRNCRSIFGWQ